VNALAGHPEFHVAGPSADITPARLKRLTIDGVELVLFRVEGECVAIENNCPHQHMAAFHQAHIEGTVIRCPMHGWTFDLKTGKSVAGGGRLRTFDVREENGTVLVRLPAGTDGPAFRSWEP
jgi:3-phenylpropionate/trans-cinnamate dioxygenase ferredoxin subunit